MGLAVLENLKINKVNLVFFHPLAESLEDFGSWNRGGGSAVFVFGGHAGVEIAALFGVEEDVFGIFDDVTLSGEAWDFILP